MHKEAVFTQYSQTGRLLAASAILDNGSALTVATVSANTKIEIGLSSDQSTSYLRFSEADARALVCELQKCLIALEVARNA